jgi:RNA polymerase sigma-70 factor (ECF subfamily)
VTVNERNLLADPFEEARPHLRAVAYRMLGSLAEAEDAVQEAWIRLSRADTSEVENLRGWLTTVVARVCLDMLRSRKARSEDALAEELPKEAAVQPSSIDPEQDAMLVDSVGVALLVVLEKLAPAERVAFVLHDLFAVSFEEIASLVGRSPAATRQLASRARRRVQGGADAGSDHAAERAVAESFLAALRAGDLERLIAVLDPDVLVRAEGAAGGAPVEIRGARTFAEGAVRFARSVGSARVALIDGAVGLVLARRGRLFRALHLEIAGGQIRRAEVVADPARLAALEIALLPEPTPDP